MSTSKLELTFVQKMFLGLFCIYLALIAFASIQTTGNAILEQLLFICLNNGYNSFHVVLCSVLGGAIFSPVPMYYCFNSCDEDLWFNVKFYLAQSAIFSVIVYVALTPSIDFLPPEDIGAFCAWVTVIQAIYVINKKRVRCNELEDERRRWIDEEYR